MKKIGRLAMRLEGKMWNAYYALPDSMEGAILLGSIAIALVSDCPERKQVFLGMMSGAVADFMESKLGARPEMLVTAAPESERAGNA